MTKDDIAQMKAGMSLMKSICDNNPHWLDPDCLGCPFGKYCDLLLEIPSTMLSTSLIPADWEIEAEKS